MSIKLDRSQFTKTLATKAKLVPHIERIIAEGEFEWEYKFDGKESDDAWHPSGDCTPTLHELWLKATGKAEPWKPSGPLFKTFQVGQFWHQYLQWVVEKRLEFCGPEHIERRGSKVWGTVKGFLDEGDVAVPYGEPYHWATGSGDIAPVDIPHHGEFLVDFKTMNSRDFAKAQTGNLPDWCATKYEAQANIYMDFFDCDRMLIIAIQKDSPHDMREFEYRRNQPLIDAVYSKWELVSACLDEGVEVPEGEDILLPVRGPHVG